MAIFNSLGSNYSFGLACRQAGFAILSLFANDSKKCGLKLSKFLEEKYGGQVLLTYKGREALRLAFRAINQKGAEVGICGFTCYAVYEAVTLEGYKVRYLDIAEGDLNFSFANLVQGIKKYPLIKVIIIQNTLGYPCEIEKIAKYCKEKGIILIEDLAHSIGAKYEDGREVGTVGDFTVLSFSQDKMVDGISGGAVIVKSSKFKIPHKRTTFFEGSQSLELGELPMSQQTRDRFYPLFTWIIRKTYEFGLGKLLHAFLKKFNLLSQPMSNLDKDIIYGLPDWYCCLIYRQFRSMEGDLNHRRKIASVYADRLKKDVLSSILVRKIPKAANLRFPIFVANRSNLVEFLKKKYIFVSDIWYDAPIAPKKYLHMTDYKNQCPNAEKISKEILNLPTHRNVSEMDAKFIAEKVNEWVEGKT